MNGTQTVHDLFRGTAEIVKTLRVGAFMLDLVVAIIAIQGLVGESMIGPWRPLLTFLLLAGAVGLRCVADGYRSFSQQCRRISIRAYALGEEVPIGQVSSLRSDAPMGAQRFASKLPASAIDEYYEAISTPGGNRLREVYAYSSFYTWQLLKTTKWIYGILFIGLLSASLIALYSMSLPKAGVDSAQIREALFSIVLGIFALRAMETWTACTASANTIRAIADVLVSAPLPEGQMLEGFVREYDVEGSIAPTPPTTIYRFKRLALDSAWRHRRGALSLGT